MFFLAFNFLCTMVMLNLIIPVVIDGYQMTQEQKLDNSKVHFSHLEDFAQVWTLFDPQRHGWIKTEKLPDLIRKLPPPLGLGSQSGSGASTRVKLQRVISDTRWDLQHRNGSIGFLDTLNSLAYRVHRNSTDPAFHPSAIRANLSKAGMEDSAARLLAQDKLLWIIKRHLSRKRMGARLVLRQHDSLWRGNHIAFKMKASTAIAWVADFQTDAKYDGVPREKRLQKLLRTRALGLSKISSRLGLSSRLARLKRATSLREDGEAGGCEEWTLAPELDVAAQPALRLVLSGMHARSPLSMDTSLVERVSQLSRRSDAAGPPPPPELAIPLPCGMDEATMVDAATLSARLCCSATGMRTSGDDIELLMDEPADEPAACTVTTCIFVAVWLPPI